MYQSIHHMSNMYDPKKMICMYESPISSLLNPKISLPLAISKRNKGGFQRIKAKEVEVET